MNATPISPRKKIAAGVMGSHCPRVVGLNRAKVSVGDGKFTTCAKLHGTIPRVQVSRGHNARFSDPTACRSEHSEESSWIFAAKSASETPLDSSLRPNDRLETQLVRPRIPTMKI